MLFVVVFLVKKQQQTFHIFGSSFRTLAVIFATYYFSLNQILLFATPTFPFPIIALPSFMDVGQSVAKRDDAIGGRPLGRIFSFFLSIKYRRWNTRRVYQEPVDGLSDLHPLFSDLSLRSPSMSFVPTLCLWSFSLVSVCCIFGMCCLCLRIHLACCCCCWWCSCCCCCCSSSSSDMICNARWPVACKTTLPSLILAPPPPPPALSLSISSFFTFLAWFCHL